MNIAQGSMSITEREAFLADVHVAILAIERPGRGPLAPARLVSIR
jgi:hypothetical protein